MQHTHKPFLGKPGIECIGPLQSTRVDRYDRVERRTGFVESFDALQRLQDQLPRTDLALLDCPMDVGDGRVLYAEIPLHAGVSNAGSRQPRHERYRSDPWSD